MSGLDTGYNFDRYRRLLAAADDEPKRLAFINLLIEEKARDRLAEHALRARLSGMGLQSGYGAEHTRPSVNGAVVREARSIGGRP